MIDNYTFDKQKAPQSLQDLVSDGYLREVPDGSDDRLQQTWRTIMEDAMPERQPVGAGHFRCEERIG